VGDFNGDGRLDLAAANDGSNSVSILLGRGDGTFSARQDFEVSASPVSVTAEDFNGDGNQDLATNSGSILLGRGDGTFSDPQNFAVGEFSGSVTVGAFNGDGQADLATANAGSNSVSIMLGRGDGTFSDPQNFAVGERPGSVTVGDFNSDGQADLVTANSEFGANSVSILINTTASEGADVIAFEDLEAGARITEVFGSRGSGPIVVQGTNPLLSKSRNAAVVFDSACPPDSGPRDCTGEDIDLGTPNEVFGGPGVGRGGASSNNTALGKVLIIGEHVEDANRDGLVDDPNDAGKGGTLQLDFSALGSVTMHTITFVDLDDPDPAQQVELFRGGVKGSLLAKVPLPVAGNNGVSVVPLNVPGVDTVVITLTDSAAIDNIAFTSKSEAAGRTRLSH
jgi:hypothetical protein